MDDRQGRYQICGPNAFNRYGFDDQIPTRVYAYNNRISGERTVGALVLNLIRVADKRLGDTASVPTTDGREAIYSSRVRTLVDAVYDWSRFNGLPRGFSWILSELSSGRVSARDLVESTLRYGDVGTRRRIGALLDREGAGLGLLSDSIALSGRPPASSPGSRHCPSGGSRIVDGASSGMTVSELPPIQLHEDPELFGESVDYTSATTGFVARLVEKDYFCSVVLQHLASVSNLVFRGGTCSRQGPCRVLSLERRSRFRHSDTR